MNPHRLLLISILLTFLFSFTSLVNAQSSSLARDKALAVRAAKLYCSLLKKLSAGDSDAETFLKSAILEDGEIDVYDDIESNKPRDFVGYATTILSFYQERDSSIIDFHYDPVAEVYYNKKSEDYYILIDKKVGKKWLQEVVVISFYKTEDKNRPEIIGIYRKEDIEGWAKFEDLRYRKEPQPINPVSKPDTIYRELISTQTLVDTVEVVIRDTIEKIVKPLAFHKNLNRKFKITQGRNKEIKWSGGSQQDYTLELLNDNFSVSSLEVVGNNINWKFGRNYTPGEKYKFLLSENKVGGMRTTSSAFQIVKKGKWKWQVPMWTVIALGVLSLVDWQIIDLPIIPFHNEPAPTIESNTKPLPPCPPDSEC